MIVTSRAFEFSSHACTFATKIGKDKLISICQNGFVTIVYYWYDPENPEF